MIEVLGTIGTVLAVIGVVLNNHLCRWCFVVWLISNSLAVVVHLITGPWSFVVRDLIFIGLAIHGWFVWKRKHKTRTTEKER